MLSLHNEYILFPFILNLLSTKDLFNLRCCSTEYKTLVDYYFRNYYSSLNSDQFRSERSILVLFTHCRKLKRVFLRHLNWLTDDTIDVLFENNLLIEELQIIGCNNLSDLSLKTVIIRFEHLRVLSLTDCNWISEGLLHLLMQHKPNVKIERLGNCDVGSSDITKLCVMYNLLRETSFIPRNNIVLVNKTLTI